MPALCRQVGVICASVTNTLQGYAFLLLRGGASLLGLGYLALLIAAFVNPPLRGAYEERDEMGRRISGAHSAPTQVLYGTLTSLGACLDCALHPSVPSHEAAHELIIPCRVTLGSGG